MVRVIQAQDARALNLPGRSSFEFVSAENGAANVTLRLVEIPVPQPGDVPRAMHRHTGFEECMYILSGHGSSESEDGANGVSEGDVILVSPGELHVTRNTGTTPLRMLCFFPTANCSEQK